MQKQIDAIHTQMRKVQLGREDVKSLREALNEVRRLIQQKMKLDEEAHQQQERERDRQKKEKYYSLKEQIESLFQEQEIQDIEQLVLNRDSLLGQIHESSLTKNEKQELERLLKPLRDVITDKREKALMALSDDDRQALQQMQAILNQRKERRQEIKIIWKFCVKLRGHLA